MSGQPHVPATLISQRNSGTQPVEAVFRIVAYLLCAGTVEPQRPRGTRATGELADWIGAMLGDNSGNAWIAPQ
jgi:hypothetical protein